MSSPADMRAGLLAVRHADATTVGTITLDSYTRCNDHRSARAVLDAHGQLNGYPIVAHGVATTSELVDGVHDDAFPVQVRHGSADPTEIFTVMRATGLRATEGGPLSYCLPYSRRSVRDSVRGWAAGCAELAEDGGAHLETFGGCMLGQLCPPSLLIAISVLEAMFFRRHGVRGVSLSYAQQANLEQDREAMAALHRLAGEHLGEHDWHVVLYAYMGVYPATEHGARALLDDAARLAVRGGAARLIVKTTAEAHRLPTVAENVAALERAASVARGLVPVGQSADTGIHAEAAAIVEAVLNLDDNLDRALVRAVERGYLDVPYCLHPDNAGRTRTHLDRDGRLHWAATGALPLPGNGSAVRSIPLPGSADLLAALTHVARTYDRRPAALCPA